MGACSSKSAVKKAPSDDASTDRESLFSAVENDDEQSVAKLLKRGIDVRRGRSRRREVVDFAVRRGRGPRDVHEPVAAERRRGVGRRRLVVVLTIFTYSVGPVLHEALVEPHVPGEVPAPFVVAFVKQTP